MGKSLFRTASWVLALFVIGPVLGTAMRHLGGIDGGSEVSLLVSDQPMLGLAMGLLAVLVATGLGGLGAWRVDIRCGMLGAGLVLAWSAWYLGGADALYEGGPRVARLIAIEGLIVGAAGVLAGAVVFTGGWRKKGEDGHDESAGEVAKDVVTNIRLAVAGLPAIAAIVATVIVALVVASIMAHNDLPGQSLAAAIIGMLAGAAAGRVAGEACGADPSPLVYFVAAGVCATIAPIAAMLAASDLSLAARSGELLGLARPMPMDWLAGAFLGSPIGARWFHATAQWRGAESGARA